MLLDAVFIIRGVDPLAAFPPDYEPDVDLFAGGGGASTGFEEAFGKSPDIAINHDLEALAMHRANHPDSLHICQNVINVQPLMATGGRLVRALWASPDCTHFSKAKGGKPRNQNIRDLAWTVIRWAEHTRPKIIGIENVEEFKSWGPLDSRGYPIKSRAGETFREWLRQLRRLGYSVSYRELRACDYGAPTTRKRLFIVARLDKKRVRWPAPTHGPGTAKAYRTAAECIDWSDPAPSIFDRKRPLARNTQRRIAEGIRRYVLAAAKPFLVTYYGDKRAGDFRGFGVDEPFRTVTTEHRFGLVSPLLVTPNHSGDAFRGQGLDMPLGTATGKGSFCLTAPHLVAIDHKGPAGGFNPSVRSMTDPLSTVTAENRHALTTASLVVKHYGGVVGHDLRRPLGAVTAIDHHSLVSVYMGKLRGTNIGAPASSPLQTISAQGKHHCLVSASLMCFYTGGGQWAELANPLPTATAKARFGLQAVHLQQYNGASEAQPVTDPLPTVSTRDRFGITAASLCQFNGGSIGKDVWSPLPTAYGRDKFGLATAELFLPDVAFAFHGGLWLPPSTSPEPGNYAKVVAFLREWGVIGPDEEAEVVVDGVRMRIMDIGLRMMRPRELFTANGFSQSYKIDPDCNGKPLSITSQVRKCGNSVPPPFVTAVFRANRSALDYTRTPFRGRVYPLFQQQEETHAIHCA